MSKWESSSTRVEHKISLKPPTRKTCLFEPSLHKPPNLLAAAWLAELSPALLVTMWAWRELTGQVSTLKHLQGTPLKFNMEPEKKFLEKVIPFGNHYFQVPC